MNTITSKIHKENPPNTSQKQIYLLTIQQYPIQYGLGLPASPQNKTNKIYTLPLPQPHH